MKLVTLHNLGLTKSEMAYKKYIKRGGKIYGPYIYHSRRVDGKVVSEYRGTSKSKKIPSGGMKFVWIFLGILVLLGAFYFLVDGNRGGLTGYSVIDLNVDYTEGESLKGKVSIFLKEGELIPESSQLIFESGNEVYEYPLKDFVSEDLVEGNFFVQNKSVSGLGIGFGTPGEKEIFPELNFVLLINSVIEGNDSLISEIEILGNVSRENDFEYVLNEGETVELKPRSVTLFDSGDQLDDDEVNLIVEENLVIVSTSYSGFEAGFGEDYIGTDLKEIVVDVSSLNLFLDPGFVKISVNYLGEELLTSTIEIQGGESVSGETVPLEDEIPAIEEPFSENETEFNFSEIEEPAILELTSGERGILENEFGNLSLRVSEAFSKNGFLTIRYQIDRYWVEFTYSDDLDNATLESFMEQDRIKWMKDLAGLLSEVETPEQELEGFVGSSFGV